MVFVGAFIAISFLISKNGLLITGFVVIAINNFKKTNGELCLKTLLVKKT